MSMKKGPGLLRRGGSLSAQTITAVLGPPQEDTKPAHNEDQPESPATTTTQSAPEELSPSAEGFVVSPSQLLHSCSPHEQASAQEPPLSHMEPEASCILDIEDDAGILPAETPLLVNVVDATGPAQKDEDGDSDSKVLLPPPVRRSRRLSCPEWLARSLYAVPEDGEIEDIASPPPQPARVRGSSLSPTPRRRSRTSTIRSHLNSSVTSADIDSLVFHHHRDPVPLSATPTLDPGPTSEAHTSSSIANDPQGASPGPDSHSVVLDVVPEPSTATYLSLRRPSWDTATSAEYLIISDDILMKGDVEEGLFQDCSPRRSSEDSSGERTYTTVWL